MVQHSDIPRAASVQLHSLQHFELPELAGISHEQVDVHLKLYEGYVTALNGLRKAEADLSADAEKNALLLDGVRRRIPFEYDGARMHELYFQQWERGMRTRRPDGDLESALAESFGSTEAWEKSFRALAKTRGIGWVVASYDTSHEQIVNHWVDEHHIGTLADAPIVLVMDLWEHAFMVDYVPSEKAEYVGAFFRNLNWDVIEERFAEL